MFPTCFAELLPQPGGVDSPACTPSFYDPGAEARRDTWAAMEFALRSGRARAIGVSNYEACGPLDGDEAAQQRAEWHGGLSVGNGERGWPSLEPCLPGNDPLEGLENDQSTHWLRGSPIKVSHAYSIIYSK